jgi:inorganic pyrophosphatase
MAYRLRVNGAPNTLEYAAYFENHKGELISPFHDIPLHADEAKGIFNIVIEIPRWSNAKLEITKGTAFNPIKQDVKKGQLRFIKNCFPHHGYIWNYGAFPQTWEDPTHTDADTKANGDNDPLDVCEIGFAVAKIGAVKQVKVLGCMALLDEGETDWKIIVIDVNDPLANELNDIEDVERKLPGFLKATEEWFRIYKIPDGKPENKFAFNGEAKNKEYALKVIKENHEAWKRLISGKVSNKTEKYEVQTVNTQVQDSPYRVAIDSDAVKAVPTHEDKPGAALDPSVDKWYFVATL